MKLRTDAHRLLGLLLSASITVLSISSTRADNTKVATGPDPEAYASMVDSAVDYLRTSGQSPDGSYSGTSSPAVTALVTTALLRHGRSVDDPMISKALSYLEGFVQEDGGIYNPGGNYRNYETCLAMLCFTEANRDGKYDSIVKGGDHFVRGLQWDSDEGSDESDVSYGGGGYGKHKRPDLSNTGFLIEALVASGSGPDDPAIQKALVFVSRCQNLESPYNTTPFAAKVNDGGFYYTIAAGGSSQAGETADGGLRSYASMTYNGLKSMIYAGVGPDDPRVKAAYDWITKHYTLNDNPGMGAAGLYYYYHTFAKALEALGNPIVTDAEGNEHDWSRELAESLAKQQQSNGSWINEENSRWLEGDPNLVTGYALMALSYCQPEKTK